MDLLEKLRDLGRGDKIIPGLCIPEANEAADEIERLLEENKALVEIVNRIGTISHAWSDATALVQRFNDTFGNEQSVERKEG